MSREVKTQVVWLPDGFGGGEHAEVCRASEYAALEAECQRLREYNHNPHHINPVSDAFHKLITESAEALSQFAAIQGGMGEVVEVVGYLDAHDCLWNETTHPDRMIPLMTVGQHQRIVAVISAQQSAHVSVPRELLERTICRLTHGHEHDKAVRELRALLNGGEA